MAKNSNPETKHVLASMGIWVKEYKLGKNCKQIATEYNIHQSTVYRRLKQQGVKIRTRSQSKMGDKNPSWKGDNIGINQIHKRVKKLLPKPAQCQLCKIKSPIDLANISNKYNRATYNQDIKNWIWLCRKCHMTQDGRIDRMYRGGRKTIHSKCQYLRCSSPHEAKGLCVKHYNTYRYNLKNGNIQNKIVQFVLLNK